MYKNLVTAAVHVVMDARVAASFDVFNLTCQRSLFGAAV
jgi:hypothetical protein